jgi:hypothetical protein
MKAFSLISEEAISKGIRRIVAITGPDAERVSDILLLPRNEAHLIEILLLIACLCSLPLDGNGNKYV